MRIALFGLPMTGKTTIFKALAGFQGEAAPTSGKGKMNEPNRAVVKIQDRRLDKLHEIYESRKKVHATVEYIDMPNPMGSAEKGAARFPDSFLGELRTTDALAYVVRVFESNTVPHIHGTVDFLRDIREINSDLILSDLAVAESAIEKLERKLRLESAASYDMKSRHDVLLKSKKNLEEERPLRSVAWTDEEIKLLRNYQFLSQKPFILILNLGEGQTADSYIAQAKKLFTYTQSLLITGICGQLEMEISQLSPEEQGVFLKEMGLGEPALIRFISQSFDLLGRMYFFTVGEDEARAWEIAKGSTAVHAAGCIHTDLSQGFICAEVFNYQDLINLGGVPSKLKEAGKFRLEGKEYVVADGDILSIRFNVSKGKK